MSYIAHIQEDTLKEQELKEHLEGTACLAQRFADAFGYGEWGYCCGKLHDIGKYSDKFQRRIRGSGETVDHATAGAQLCRELGGYYNLLSYCIAGHHAGLPDTGGSADAMNSSTMEGRMKKKIEDFQAFREEVNIPQLKKEFFLKHIKEDPSFTISFFIRMMYSCLVDADYLDTEWFMQSAQTKRQIGEAIEVLWAKFQKHVSGWLKCEDMESINGRRTEILKHCMVMGNGQKGLFRLTVPTGGGKTVASLAFALRHAAKHKLDRIIYVIPYTSIIEQNANVFSDILGQNNVLENHCNVNYQESEELRPMQLASENWDKPVVVTTNVQFFESLFSNKSSRCRKLHNITNSVIIFDETQMLPNDYLKPCISAIEELIRYYGCSAVLCTATQPALQQLFSDDMTYCELCPRVEEQFAFFKRCMIMDAGKISKQSLVSKLKQEKRVLCICNTKKRVREIYGEMKGEGVYHLSTFMYPKHRKEILSEIRLRLKKDETCIVIATSLVEAGVDLDFQTVYRELAGLDSIIQAAGRCNREGSRAFEESGTFIFQFEEAEQIPGQEQNIDISKQILRKYQDISELKAIHEYFARLYQFKGSSLDKKNIRGQFQKGSYSFAKVGREFQIIEQNTKTILIPVEEQAKKIAEELRIKGATRSLIREAGQYCVNVYENLFRKMQGAGMLIPVSEDLKEDLFLLKDATDYTREMGLNIDVNMGSGIWF